MEHSNDKELWPKVLVSTEGAVGWGIQSIRVSAEERSCQEGVCTVTLDRQARDESEKKM